MLEVFLCCSPADQEVAAAITARLEHGAEVTVALDDSEPESAAVKWKWGRSCAAILLLLSPEAVPPRVSRADWGELLDHIASNADPPIGSLLVRGCGYPRLLERRHFFRWDGGPREALRAIEKWALRLHRLPQQPSFVPAQLPWFEGRARELDLLWETLVDRAGTAVVVNPAAASGKTSLAQEFSRRAGAHFRDLLWVACGDRSPASIVADLAQQIGAECQGEAGEAFAGLVDLAGRHRVLLVLDDLQPILAVPADSQGRASVLVTTRSTQVEAPPAAQVIRIDKGPEFPLAVPDNPVDLRLWRAMAVCRPSGFPLELAARIAGIEPADVPGACARLIQGRLVDPFDGGRLRLNALSLAAAGDLLEMERRRHAEVVYEAVSGWAKNPDFNKQYGAELIPAFQWATSADWPLACALVRHAFALLRHYGRLAEGTELLVALGNAADLRSDRQVSDECSWELSWIRGVPYRGAYRGSACGDQLSFDFGV